MLEKEIKKKLINKLKRRKGDVYEELQAGTIRADVCLLTDNKFIGYEIKSEGDTLKRFISGQRVRYLKFFDEVWLIVDKKHLTQAYDMLISYHPYLKNSCPWGLMDDKFKVILQAKPNTSALCKDTCKLSKLWKKDLLAECKARGVKNYYKMNCKQLRESLAELISPDETRKLVRHYLIKHKEEPWNSG